MLSGRRGADANERAPCRRRRLRGDGYDGAASGGDGSDESGGHLMKREHKEVMKRRARNICLIVAYDGTDYHGFQRQTPPVVAVQNVLEKVLSRVFGDAIELAAAGRTDAGVHAAGQVVNFFTNGTIPVERVARAVNSLLPPDIVVRHAFEADRDFSALHSAQEKMYRYRILTGEMPNPFLCRFVWHIR